MTEGSDRPRVFDPDTGETLGEAGFEPAPAQQEPAPARRGRTRAITAIGVVVALVIGAAGGVSWQRHHDASARKAAVDLTVRLATSEGSQVASNGEELVPFELENDGEAPLIVTSLDLKGSGATGHTGDRATIAPNASIAFNVPLTIPCAGPDVAALDATVGLTTADGKTRTTQRDVIFDGQTLSPTCSPSAGDTSSPPQPQAVVTGFKATATGFTATVRITIANGQPTTLVSVEAVPLTPDPAESVPVSAGKPKDITVTLTPKNACFRSASWQNIPTTFTVEASASSTDTIESDLLLPYALYRGVLHDLDVMCPQAGTS